jgi:hypothetical protein
MYLKIDLTLSHVKCFNFQAMQCPPKHQLVPAIRKEYWLLLRDSFISALGSVEAEEFSAACSSKKMPDQALAER